MYYRIFLVEPDAQVTSCPAIIKGRPVDGRDLKIGQHTVYTNTQNCCCCDCLTNNIYTSSIPYKSSTGKQPTLSINRQDALVWFYGPAGRGVEDDRSQKTNRPASQQSPGLFWKKKRGRSRDCIRSTLPGWPSHEVFFWFDRVTIQFKVSALIP